MQEHLKLLVEILDELDSNPQKTMRFVTQAVGTTTISNKPPDDIRYQLIRDISFKFAYHNMYAGDEQLTMQYVDDFMLKIGNKYINNQHLCWRAHDHHFHKSFEEYVNCPITCLCEIGEFLNKLGRTLYAG